MNAMRTFEEISLFKQKKEFKKQPQHEENGEVYSEYLDNLTVLDLMKLSSQGFKIVTSNGHIIAIIPEESDLLYGYGYFLRHCMENKETEA